MRYRRRLRRFGRIVPRRLRGVSVRRIRWGLALSLGFVSLALAGAAFGPAMVRSLMVGLDPERASLRAALEPAGAAPMRSGYARRDFRPIWLRGGKARPETQEILRMMTQSRLDGLDPQRYETETLIRRVQGASSASWADRAQTELMVTGSFARYLADLHLPPPAAQLIYTDAALRGPVAPTVGQLLSYIDAAPSLEGAVQGAVRMNPLYLQYRRLAAPLLQNPAHPLRLTILANLERLRALPVNPGRRFILVDTANARLWMFQDGQPVDTMKVIVGKPDEATPMLAGVVRYAMFNPRWNVPPDLVQKVYAPRFEAQPQALAALHMDPWTDYSANARQLDPSSIRWEDVAAGRLALGLRQRPGPDNAMGAVKFMLPNELGIYLHDTPNKALFQKPIRMFSAGCVRVEDFRRLARWLYGRDDMGPRGGAADQRIDVPSPAPVYITYLTANFDHGRLIQTADIYGRDAALQSQLRTGQAVGQTPAYLSTDGAP